MAMNVTEEVLRAMANLNANQEANWTVIKEWLRGEHFITQRLAAYGIDVPYEKVRVFQGMAFVLNDLSYYADNAKEHLEKMRAVAASRKDRKLEGTS